MDGDGCSSLCELEGGASACPLGGCDEKTVVGTNGACYLSEDGEVQCWGLNTELINDAPAGVWVDIDLEFESACAIDSFGHPFCWGPNAATGYPTASLESIVVTQYAACGIRRDDGLIECWGGDDFGVLSGANTTDAFAELATTQGSVCGIHLSDGSLECWGLPSNYLLGNPTFGTFVAIRGGADNYCAQADDGLWTCFGSNSYGETFVPSEPFVDVAMGIFHGCGLRADATVDCWGAGPELPSVDYGQTGVPGELADVFRGFAASSLTTCGVRLDGRVECWGRYTDNDPLGADRSLEPPGTCGNGTRDLPEACDDGNQVDDDGCSADCESDESCGNRQLDPIEVCDDGNQVDGDDCSADCMESFLCDTGGLSEAEFCEDGLECTVGACDPQLGCVQTPTNEGAGCAGGAGICRSGACVISKTVVGAGTACHLSDLGDIQCWGLTLPLVDQAPPGVWIDLDVEAGVACALDAQGQPSCWGENPIARRPHLPSRFVRFDCGRTKHGVRDWSRRWTGALLGQQRPRHGRFGKHE